MNKERFVVATLVLASSGCDTESWGMPENPKPVYELTDSVAVNEMLDSLRTEFQDLCFREGPDASGDRFSALSLKRDLRLREDGYPVGKIGWMCHYPRTGKTVQENRSGEFEQLVASGGPLRRVQARGE